MHMWVGRNVGAPRASSATGRANRALHRWGLRRAASKGGRRCRSARAACGAACVARLCKSGAAQGAA
eukprot:8394725-Alexandrium_andersonii.AAC.1